MESCQHRRDSLEIQLRLSARILPRTAGEIFWELANPVVIRNRSEILPRVKALSALNLVEGEKGCLFAYNGNPGEYERTKKMYSYLEDEGYQMVYSSNYLRDREEYSPNPPYSGMTWDSQSPQ